MTRNRILIALGVAVLLGGGWWIWRSTRAAAPVSYETVPVKRGRLVAKVTASGTLSAIVTVQVGAQVSGRISQIDADFNTPVKKGQIIAKLDPALFEAAVEQAKANLVAAEGKLDKSKADAADLARQYERSKTLFEQKLIAQADLDTAQSKSEGAQADVRSATGAVAQAKAALHKEQTSLAYTTITSPINGTVISRAVDVGQTVAASLSAPTLFTIAEDLRKMQVDTSVAEADVGKLKPGMQASFFVDAYPSKKFKGTVRQIRNAATTQQNVVTYDAVIDVENPDLELKPGMTATVTFIYAERDDALTVANSALRFRPPPGFGGKGGGNGKKGKHKKESGDAATPRTVAQRDPGAGAPRTDASPARPGETEEPGPEQREVWVLAGGVPHPVSIVTGVSDGTSTEVVSGDLHEGDEVITGVSGGTSSATGAKPGGMRRMF